MDRIYCNDETCRKIGYGVICLVLREIIVGAKRIAFTGELRSLKMEMDPEDVHPQDIPMLELLQEPHIRLACKAMKYIDAEIRERYSLITGVIDDDVLEDEEADELCCSFVNRFLYWRSKNRRRDRYLNFNKTLCTAQRAVYEVCKLIITGETRVNDMTYRSNYSVGRLKALIAGNEDGKVKLLVELIEKLMEWEAERKTLPEIAFESAIPKIRLDGI